MYLIRGYFAFTLRPFTGLFWLLKSFMLLCLVEFALFFRSNGSRMGLEGPSVREYASPVVTGASDAWNDVMGKSATTLMLRTPEPFFLDSWMADEWRKTATNEAEKLISCLKPFDEKLVSFIRDTKNKIRSVHKDLSQD